MPSHGEPSSPRRPGPGGPGADPDARRLTDLAGSAVRRLRALRRRRASGALSEDDYRRVVAAELEDDEPPSPGREG